MAPFLSYIADCSSSSTFTRSEHPEVCVYRLITEIHIWEKYPFLYAAPERSAVLISCIFTDQNERLVSHLRERLSYIGFKLMKATLREKSIPLYTEAL